MAGAMVSSLTWLVEKLVRSLGSSSELCDVEEDPLVEDLMKLKRTLLRISAVLDDAEEREIVNESVELWLSELKDLAYDTEDVLDEYEYELQRAKVEGGATPWPTASVAKKRDVGPNQAEASHTGKQEEDGTQAVSGSGAEEVGTQTQATRKGKQKEVCDVIPSPVEIPFRSKLTYRIRKIMERFDEIAKHRDLLHLRESDGKRQSENSVRLTSGPYIDESEFYGRSDDKKRLIELLLSNDCRGSNFSVIPIVGMGGVGKTALVQLAYNDSRVCGHFSIMGWVCVSEDFNVARITEAILQSFTQRPTGLTELSALQDRLKKLLCKDRFLLVLDDVWNEKPEEWDVLKAPLRFGREGSKVVITTRNESVARIMRTVPFYRLECLSGDDCWMLFQRLAFDGEDPNAYPHLVEIGKKIAKKCSGLPLAAKMLGSLLRCETQVQRWEDVLENDLWDLGEDEILSALRLSYVHLPTHLKRCFVYCSLFPKAYGWEKNQLVRLWIAQGFVQPKARKQVEEIGADYFDQLLRRSFFQYIDGEKVFVMHDLILDLARSISLNEYSIIDQDASCNVYTEARHLSFISYAGGQGLLLQSFYEYRALRTLLLIDGKRRGFYGREYFYGPEYFNVKMSDDFFQNFRFLRALDLSYTDIELLPDTVGNLKHLRYLGLNQTKIKMLPDSVCNLYNLQTLELQNCSWMFKELPKDMSKLTNLRHLITDHHLPSVRMHPGIGKLTSLQTLTVFNSECCQIQELRGLVNLRELGIYWLMNVRNAEDAKEADMKNKKSLAKLNLTFGHRLWYVLKDEENEVAEDVLEHLEPHPSLTELVIEGYGGVRFPRWIEDPSFSRLVDVNLSSCDNCKILPALGQLPSLRYLVIFWMNGVKHVGREFCGHNDAAVTRRFPSLETLQFTFMGEWEEWNGVEDGDFPRLRSLTLRECHKLRSLPHLPPSLTELKIFGCNKLELHDSFSEKIWSSSLTNLESLYISHSESLSSIPLHNLEKLQNLMICACPELTSIDCWSSSGSSSHISQGLHHLTSLRRLEIGGCPKLCFTPDTPLPLTLEVLNIVGCPNMKEWCHGFGSGEPACITQLNFDYDETDWQLIVECSFDGSTRSSAFLAERMMARMT